MKLTPLLVICPLLACAAPAEPKFRLQEIDKVSIGYGLAIADVDALIPADSPVDDCARTNTTSVYTAGSIFPMLPERFSTDLTSLNQDEDRLALVVEMTVEPDGSARHQRFAMSNAGGVDGMARAEVVAAVEHNIGRRHARLMETLDTADRGEHFFAQIGRS